MAPPPTLTAQSGDCRPGRREVAPAEPRAPRVTPPPGEVPRPRLPAGKRTAGRRRRSRRRGPRAPLPAPGPGRVSRVVRWSAGLMGGILGATWRTARLLRDGQPSLSAAPRDGSGRVSRVAKSWSGSPTPGFTGRGPDRLGHCRHPVWPRWVLSHRPPARDEGPAPSRSGPQADFDAGPTSISRWWVPPMTSTTYDGDRKMSSTSPDVWREVVSWNPRATSRWP